MAYKRIRPEEVIGQKYNRLTAVEQVTIDGKENQLAFKYKCDCGGEITKLHTRVKSGATRSCGCIRKEQAAINGKSATTHGMKNTPEYRSWRAMKARCNNPNRKDHHNYMGKGIRVCKQWKESFEQFYEDMGPRPEGTTLERSNSDLNYEPSNCVWATPKEQANNISTNIEEKVVQAIINDYINGMNIPSLKRKYKGDVYGVLVRRGIHSPQSTHTKLSTSEKEQIQRMVMAGFNTKDIAKSLNRPVSTINRFKRKVSNGSGARN